MTTINRRTALVGAVTLPAALAPGAALAGSANLPTHAEPDPFVAAFSRYVEAEEAFACGSAWNKDPLSGVIGVQTGPP